MSVIETIRINVNDAEDRSITVDKINDVVKTLINKTFKD